jgi:hypothetical protein
MFSSVTLNYEERFIILYTLSNLPAHDLDTARLFMDIEEPLEFENVENLGQSDEKEIKLDLVLFPTFIGTVTSAIGFTWKKRGYPPQLGRLALLLQDRLVEMVETSTPDDVTEEPSETPVEENTAENPALVLPEPLQPPEEGAIPLPPELIEGGEEEVPVG